MAGTPTKMAAFRSSIRSSTLTASKRPSAATGTPARANPRPEAKPMMWAMGRAMTAVGAGSRFSAPSLDAPMRARWLSRTPFGRPVVPEV